MPLCKVSGHQYFMPLELSLFLCKLLGLPDGQGPGSLIHQQAVPSSPPCSLAWCCLSSSSVCSAATALPGPRGHRQPEARLLTWGTHRWKDLTGERGDSCLFSARPCRFLFSHEEPGRWAARGSCPSFQVKSPGHPASQGQSCSRHLPAAQSSSHRTPHEP